MPKKKGGKKDSITGMRVGNGLTIFSDKIYTHDSPEIVRLIGETDGTWSPGGGREWEFEFSKKAVIISSKTTGQLTLRGLKTSNTDWRDRVVGIGKFKAGKDGILKKVTIKESSDWTWSPATPPTTKSAGGPASNRILGFRNKTKITSQEIEANPASIFYALAKSPEIYSYSSNVQPSMAHQYNTFDEFKSLKSSKYFENGWWENPFAPDLI